MSKLEYLRHYSMMPHKNIMDIDEQRLKIELKSSLVCPPVSKQNTMPGKDDAGHWSISNEVYTSNQTKEEINSNYSHQDSSDSYSSAAQSAGKCCQEL